MPGPQVSELISWCLTLKSCFNPYPRLIVTIRQAGIPWDKLGYVLVHKSHSLGFSFIGLVPSIPFSYRCGQPFGFQWCMHAKDMRDGG